MANRVLNQSESQGRDLAEQMSQRLKVTEMMLSEAVKDRERLVTENQTAVENLLATISSKDQLLKVMNTSVPSLSLRYYYSFVEKYLYSFHI